MRLECENKENDKAFIEPILAEGSMERGELCTITGLNDRLMRRYINELRKEGCPIINCGDGSGYKFAESLEEFNTWKRIYLSRAIDCLETVRKMEEALHDYI